MVPGNVRYTENDGVGLLLMRVCMNRIMASKQDNTLFRISTTVMLHNE